MGSACRLPPEATANEPGGGGFGQMPPVPAREPGNREILWGVRCKACRGLPGVRRLESAGSEILWRVRQPARRRRAGRYVCAPKSYTQTHLAQQVATARGALEGERKQVTVLFCDIANSTALAEQIGAEAMHATLNKFFELTLGELHRYECIINQFGGDGFMALGPVAHEIPRSASARNFRHSALRPRG
jgi:adenylate/guanylate cyclase family protein